MIRKPRHTVSSGQSLVDVAIQRYGSAEGLFRLLAENPAVGMANVLVSGQELVYDPATPVNAATVRLFREQAHIVNCDQRPQSCGNLTSDMWSVQWTASWNGTKWVPASALFLHSGIVFDALYTEDMRIYNEAGVLVGQTSPGLFPNLNPHTDFYTKDSAYGTVNQTDFGFLPGIYRHVLSFDQVTLIDGTVCSGIGVFVLEFFTTWETPPAIPNTNFNYVLPILFS